MKREKEKSLLSQLGVFLQSQVTRTRAWIAEVEGEHADHSTLHHVGTMKRKVTEIDLSGWGLQEYEKEDELTAKTTEKKNKREGERQYEREIWNEREIV